MAETMTNKRAANKTAPAKKPAAKRTAAKKAASSSKSPRPRVTKSGAARTQRSAAPGSTRTAEAIEVTAASKYLAAVLSHTGEQAQEWDAAGRALADEVRSGQARAARQLPEDSYAQRLATASPADVASLLRVHQDYLEEVSRVADTLTAAYEQAVTEYTKKAQALWEESRQRAADDFARYVDELRRELTAAAADADPEALATLGGALIAMAQLSGAARSR